MSSFPVVGKTVPTSTSPSITVPPDGWPTDEESRLGVVSAGAVYETFPEIETNAGKHQKLRLTFAGQDLLDPRELREHCINNDQTAALFWGRANGFMQKAGRHSGIGYVLMTAGKYREIEEPAKPQHTFAISDGNNNHELKNLAIVKTEAVLVSLSDADVPPSIAHENSAFLLTVGDARWYANATSSRVTLNPTFSWGGPDGSGGNRTLGDLISWIWEAYLRPLFHDKELLFFGAGAWADALPKPRDFHFEGLSAWDAFFSVLDAYGLRFTLDHDAQGWVYRTDETMPDEAQWKKAAPYRVDSRAQDMQPFVPEKIQVCCNSRDFQWWRKPDAPYLTAADIWRRYPSYLKEFETASLSASVDSDRVVAGTTSVVWAPLHAETCDSGEWIDQTELDDDLEDFANRWLDEVANAKWRDDLFSGCWPVRAGVYFSGVHWFDHGDGLFTRLISTPVELSPAMAPCPYNESSWEGELTTPKLPDLAHDRQPWYRGVWGELFATYFKEEELDKVKKDEWGLVEIFSGHVRKPTVLWEARQIVRAIHFGDGDLAVAERPRVHCVWDYQLGQGGEWVIVPGPGTVEAGKMGIAQVCTASTNSCCLLDGKITMTNNADDTCDLERCTDPVWLICENDQLPAETLVSTLNIPDGFGGNVSSGDFCGWAKKTPYEYTCGGDTRDVWAIRCPCPPCECPADDEVVRVRWIPEDIACAFPEFEMSCVTRDPITGTVTPGNKHYWGEFSIDGQYPKVGFEFPLNDTIQVNGEDVDIVLLVYVGGDNPCAPEWEYWCDVNGDLIQIDPQELDPAGSLGTAVPIIDDETGFVRTYTRTFYYGLLGICDPAAMKPTVVPVVLYHLPGGDAAPSTTLDSCAGGEDVVVPVLGSADYEDPESSIGLYEVNDCCGISDKYTFDPEFGDDSNAVHTEHCGQVGIPAGTNDVDVDYPTMAYHVFGGCRDFLQSVWGDTAGFFDTAGGNGSHGPLIFQMVWSSSDAGC